MQLEMKAEGVTGKIGKKLGEEENQPRNGKKYNKKKIEAGRQSLFDTHVCISDMLYQPNVTV